MLGDCVAHRVLDTYSLGQRQTQVQPYDAQLSVEQTFAETVSLPEGQTILRLGSIFSCGEVCFLSNFR